MKKIPILLLIFGLLCSCSHTISPEKITAINIIDRNGLAETISAKERLNNFKKTDFLASQPYQKVHRIYARDKNGNVTSRITSYHPNGEIKQFLEAVNNRALGTYKEWHPNGQLKIESSIVGGIADINSQAEESWLFEGENRAWDEDGNLLAEILYSKGELDGVSQYYHPNGKVWKLTSYVKGGKTGTEKIYLQDSTLFQTTEYKNGLREGASVRYWGPSHIAYQEVYQDGLLLEAEYFEKSGSHRSNIHEGEGLRAILGKESLQELQEYHRGTQEGVVKLLNTAGGVIRTYSTKNGAKHGEEIDYFPSRDNELLPKLQLTWQEGTMEGPVKTWYEDGNFESQKEISQNKRNGLSTAWYRDGSLMLVEEYDNDELIKGEYYKNGEKDPVSTVAKGSGVATLFNCDGNFSKKVSYQAGKPLS
ncbi:MAG: hypothetical protein K1000chlam4_00056 [Chlamydiae bacterium]|nr:hypothetical protein [Chlamydiota bacterium]